MKKSLTNKTIYDPNERVKVTVVNKPISDEQTGEKLGYGVEVTIKYKPGILKEELRFSTDKQISNFLAGIDVEDPQQELLGPDSKK